MIITFCAESPRIMHTWKPVLTTTVIHVSPVMRMLDLFQGLNGTQRT